MIDKNFSKKQIGRLYQLDGYPQKAPEAISELIRALQDSTTENIAESVVGQVIEAAEQCPKPSQLRELVRVANARLSSHRENCARCHGSGSVASWWLVTEDRNPDGTCFRRREQIPSEAVYEQLRKSVKPPQRVYSAAAKCSCHAGYEKAESA